VSRGREDKLKKKNPKKRENKAGAGNDHGKYRGPPLGDDSRLATNRNGGMNESRLKNEPKIKKN